MRKQTEINVSSPEINLLPSIIQKWKLLKSPSFLSAPKHPVGTLLLWFRSRARGGGTKIYIYIQTREELIFQAIPGEFFRRA